MNLYTGPAGTLLAPSDRNNARDTRKSLYRSRESDREIVKAPHATQAHTETHTHDKEFTLFPGLRILTSALLRCSSALARLSGCCALISLHICVCFSSIPVFLSCATRHTLFILRALSPARCCCSLYRLPLFFMRARLCIDFIFVAEIIGFRVGPADYGNFYAGDYFVERCKINNLVVSRFFFVFCV